MLIPTKWQNACRYMHKGIWNRLNRHTTEPSLARAGSIFNRTPCRASNQLLGHYLVNVQGCLSRVSEKMHSSTVPLLTIQLQFLIQDLWCRHRRPKIMSESTMSRERVSVYDYQKDARSSMSRTVGDMIWFTASHVWRKYASPWRNRNVEQHNYITTSSNV